MITPGGRSSGLPDDDDVMRGVITEASRFLTDALERSSLERRPIRSREPRSATG
jgi:hypothetical protein